MAAESSTPFDHIAREVMERWHTTLDLSVTAMEVERARAYLHECGLTTTPAGDGLFVVGDGRPLDGTHLVFLSLRYFVERPQKPRG